jgi:hypothetical protein
VPIQDNDWYYIRESIKVGMKVQVEVLVIVLSPILVITGNIMHFVYCLAYDEKLIGLLSGYTGQERSISISVSY